MDDSDPQTLLREFLSQKDYPCVGARSVLRRSALTMVGAGSMTDPDEASLRAVGAALRAAAAGPPAPDRTGWRSTAVAFRGPSMGEEAFERALWALLWRLAEQDDTPWAAQVSADPADARFGFSFAGEAFFVVGMHPAASRRARRSPVPVVVFNAHRQFEALREAGTFRRLRDVIRRRDEHWQGSVNPMVADHGEGSEACQYAGRAVPPDWRAPLPDGSWPGAAS